MQEQKHTPGKWYYPKPSLTNGYYTIIDEETGNVVAKGIDGEANAALIASAPALLEENQRMRKALSQIEDWTSVKSIPLVNDINRCAKDALTKAGKI